MIQLTYQPAFDPFHTIFRFMRLREAILERSVVSRDHFRVLDFYLQFPFRVEALRLTTKHRKFKRLAKDYSFAKPYGELPDDRSLFIRMKSIQLAAADTMVAKGLFSASSFKNGLIENALGELPSVLLENVRHANAKEESLMEFLSVLALDYELLGENGLKHRSGLMEYRYDAA